MKRLFQICILFVLSISMLGQTTIKQTGFAFKYNGKNTRTPLGKVYIKVAASPNGVLSDSTSGKFSLQINGLSMGSHLGNVVVQKRGMMIFNQHAVDEWNIRKDPLQLILCDVDEFEKQKQDLIAIGQREAKRRYEKRIAEIESSYQTESAEWYHKLSEADKELQRIREHIGEYADLFARIDKSEIDTLAQQAIDLFNEGKIVEAVHMFEEGHYMEKLKMAIRTINQGHQLITAIHQNIENAQKDKNTYLQSLNAQIEAYKLQGEYEKAGELLKNLADELNTLEDYNEYAWFCKVQNNFSEAEVYYKKMIAYIDSSSSPKQEKMFSYSAVYHSLGEIYLDTQDYKKSEDMLLKAITYRRELVKLDSLTYLPKLARTLNDLGILYVDSKDFEHAEKCYLEALSIKKALYDMDSTNYAIDIARTLNNLGTLYIRDYNYESSESMLNEALSILQKSENDSEDYCLILRKVYNSLGLLYGDVQNDDKYEEFVLKSLRIGKEMAHKNPEAYNPSYAISLNNAAIMYCKKGNFQLGEEMLLENKTIYEELVKRNPEAYEIALSRTYGNLGILYKLTKRFDESKEMYYRDIKILKRQYDVNPNTYGGSYANTLANLASLYEATEQLDSQLIALKESYSILKSLTKKNPRRYERDYIDVLIELGRILFIQKSYIESEAYYSEAIPIYRRLAESNPSSFHSKLSATLLIMSANNIYIRKYIDSEEYAREGIGLDPNNHLHYTNLAAALLFQGKYAEAEQVYRQYKDELKESFLDDFKQYAEAGVIPKEYEADVEKINKILK